MLALYTASAIENAQLYNTLEQKVKERTRELAEKNKQIMDSIDYAEGIQRAILPLSKKIKEALRPAAIKEITRLKEAVANENDKKKKENLQSDLDSFDDEHIHPPLLRLTLLFLKKPSGGGAQADHTFECGVQLEYLACLQVADGFRTAGRRPWPRQIAKARCRCRRTPGRNLE